MTAPTTTSSGGGSPPSSLSVSSVKTLVVGHGARRRVVLTLSVNQNARARVLLLKGARTVASKRSPVKKGTNRLTLAVPRKARAGAYTLRITVSTAKGDTRGIRRKVRLPR